MKVHMNRLAIVAALVIVTAGTTQAQTVTPGYDSTAILKGAVRYKSFNSGNGGEIYLGLSGLGAGARVEKDFYRGTTCDGTTPYGSWQASNAVKFTYDPSFGLIETRVTASHNYCLTYNVGDPGVLNYLQLDVVNRASGTTVNLLDVVLNGSPLGDFYGVGWKTWMVTGVDLSGGFTLEGKVVLDGTQPGGETNKVQITVGALANQPPDCSNAIPSIAVLWPPDHKFVAVDILGVSDPDGDPVTVMIDSIRQDEPVDSTGDGAFAPDAEGVGTPTASLRAERDGAGNGRVYHIFFTASDGKGGTCSGEVLVGVPKNQGKNSNAIDDGALHDSTATAP